MLRRNRWGAAPVGALGTLHGRSESACGEAREGGMSAKPGEILEKLLRDNDLAWVIDWFVPPEQARESLLGALEEANRESSSRFGPGAPQLTEEVLAHEYQRNPHKVQAFLQALASSRTPALLVMVWRILQGMRIEQVDMN